MKNILITGHRGFIGRNLFNKIDAIGVDLKEGRDVLDLVPDDLEGIKYVFHFAAFPKVPYSIDNPIQTNRDNLDATLHLLDCAAKAGVKRFIYSSSSAVYGIRDEKPDPLGRKMVEALEEDMKPNPLSPYAVQKLTGEYYCKLYAELYGLETVCLRYFNVFGDDMSVDDAYSACLAIFLRNKEEDRALAVFGGEQTRDFVSVDDIIRANILAAKSNKVGKGEVINIGSGKDYSIKKIAEAISDKIVYLPQRVGEPKYSLADIKKASRLLDWSPTIDVMDWLKTKI